MASRSPERPFDLRNKSAYKHYTNSFSTPTKGHHNMYMNQNSSVTKNYNPGKLLLNKNIYSENKTELGKG
jgi:hypothetical protein